MNIRYPIYEGVYRILTEYYRENKKEKILVIYVIFRIFFLFKS